MGLTLGQAQALGLGHLHPATTRDTSAERALLDRLALASGPAHAKAAIESDGMNKLERAFRDQVLEKAYVAHGIARYWREPIKLRLAGRTWYAPDWLVEISAGEHGLPSRLVFVETKGFMRDDASVKIKVAAAEYPCFEWLLVTRPKHRRWEVRLVTGRGGIGREPICVPWMEV